MQLTDYFDWQSAFDRTVLENGRDLYDAGKAKKLSGRQSERNEITGRCCELIRRREKSI